ncbi:MAG: nicotinate-nucleotide adenylyltransferase [Gammaproteobacteria bacterium]
MSGPIGIFGGTFDPVHVGHLRSAVELQAAYRLDEIRFIPTGAPPHKDSTFASAGLRVQMLAAAIDGRNGFVLDTREIERSGPSYSVLTLEELRAEFPERPLCLILGMDAFLGIESWHDSGRIFELAHIIVAHRPGWTLPDQGSLGQLAQEKLADNSEDLHRYTHGCLLDHDVTQLEVSSSLIRHLVADGQDPEYLVPRLVKRIIKQSGCYAPTSLPEGTREHG